jgi:uncharacterized protein YxjI
MEIDINQKKISIGDKFQVFIDGLQTHHAAAKIFRIFSEINLFDMNSDFPLITIKKRFSFFRARYDISRRDGASYQFVTKSFWKAHFQCIAGADLYDIYGHRGRKYSVYKNDHQLAWWDKKAVTWFNGDNYKIIADKNADTALIIAFCLTIDNYSSNDKDKKAVNINIGRIGPQARQFDPEWLPEN